MKTMCAWCNHGRHKTPVKRLPFELIACYSLTIWTNSSSTRVIPWCPVLIYWLHLASECYCTKLAFILRQTILKRLTAHQHTVTYCRIAGFIKFQAHVNFCFCAFFGNSQTPYIYNTRIIEVIFTPFHSSNAFQSQCAIRYNAIVGRGSIIQPRIAVVCEMRNFGHFPQ